MRILTKESFLFLSYSITQPHTFHASSIMYPYLPLLDKILEDIRSLEALLALLISTKRYYRMRKILVI